MLCVLWSVGALMVMVHHCDMADTTMSTTRAPTVVTVVYPNGTRSNNTGKQYLPLLGDDPLGLQPKVPGSEYAKPPGGFGQQKKSGLDGVLSSDSGNNNNRNGGSDQGATYGREGFDQGAAQVGYSGDSFNTNYKAPSRPYTGFQQSGRK
ncbi:hypothetical protein HDE_04896 [Halotydeus destructor]|nr:hypothetical protein HDE_04896 [Halotydeus destructor]